MSSRCAERGLEGFLDDDMVQAAVIRCIEVIGEAARLVSEETRKRAPEIPWPLVTGMRHVLAHDYGTVDIDMVPNASPAPSREDTLLEEGMFE